MSAPDESMQLFLRLLRPCFDRAAKADGMALGPSADWATIHSLAEKSRTVSLLHSLVPTDGVPPDARARWKQGSMAEFAKTTMRSAVLSSLAESLQGIRWAVLRGPVLGQALYGDLMLRPFSDLDLLVMPSQVEEALRRLDEMGAVPFRGALSDDYYRTYHLHIQREWKQGPAASLLELHWAIDHPYSLFTPDIEGVLQRVVPVEVRGAEVPMPHPDDLLVLLCMHVLKHAVWLPVQVERGNASDLVEDGDLLGLLDVALLVCREPHRLSWEVVASRAEAWGAGRAVRTCLDAVEQVWPGSIDGRLRERFPQAVVTSRRRRQYERRNRESRWLRSVAGRAVFRPVRSLELVDYLFPPREYLNRRYGNNGIVRRVQHATAGGCKMAANAIALGREAGR